MKKGLYLIAAWIAAALCVTILGVAIQTQNVIARLGSVGADIGLGHRLSMTAYDILHLGSLYGVFIAIGVLVAFLVGALVYRLAGFGRPVVFAVAGAVGMLVMLMAMKQAFFGVHLIAGARDAIGIVLQMLAGAGGGWVFATLTRTKASPSGELA